MMRKQSKPQKVTDDLESLESHASMRKKLYRQLATIRAERKKKEGAPFVAQRAYLETLILPFDCLDSMVISILKKNGKDEEGECYE